MKVKIKYIFGIAITMMILVIGCTTEEYSLGDLDAPTNVLVNVQVVGQDSDNPNGDGSGDVIVNVTADNALGYKINFGAPNDNLVAFKGTATKKYTLMGVHDYTITVVAYGEGGAATTVTKEVSVRSVFSPDPKIVTDLTGDDSKTWVVDKSAPGHFGVGPWEGAATPVWWSAGVNEKVDCCNCFYTATFTFIKQGTNDFTLDVDTPDGAFTKTGSLTNLPGIPGSGDEGCYDYGGATSAFSFVPSSTGISASTPSTQTSISLASNSTFIGYGALQSEYEIMEISEDYLYLRVQGTETGNAWYLKLVPAS